MFDFNKTPLAPPGCECIAFTPPLQRTSWGYHGQKAWYVRPAMNHYGCVHAINASTGRESTVKTIQFLPHNFSMPAFSSHDNAIKATYDLTMALKNPHPAAPLLPPNAKHVEELRQLATIFSELANPKPIAAPDPSPRVVMPNTSKTLPPPRVVANMAHTAAGDTNNTTLLNAVIVKSGDEPLHLANPVCDADSGHNLEYRHLIWHPTPKKVWLRSAANEFGRLAHGIRDIKGTDTIKFIAKHDVPKHQTVAYGRFVCDIRRQKVETPHASHSARWMAMDISNFYLNTPLPRSEFMKIPIAIIPGEIIEQYNLREQVDANDFVFIEINKGMYALPQAGILANQLLQRRLAKHGYFPVRHTPGYWKHVSKNTTFVLVVDDFSVKNTSKDDAEDLLNALREHYTVKADWNAMSYCGITSDWDYSARTVTLSMPGYIDASILRELKHPHLERPQHSPHAHIPI